MSQNRNEKGLTNKQALYIETAMEYPQLPQAEIAKKCGVHPNTVSKWSHEPLFEKALDERLMEQWKDLRRSAQESMALLVADCNVVACKYVLDSCGYAPSQKIDATVNGDVAITIGLGDD